VAASNASAWRAVIDSASSSNWARLFAYNWAGSTLKESHITALLRRIVPEGVTCVDRTERADFVIGVRGRFAAARLGVIFRDGPL
jgi:hypothetical protein